MTTKEQALSSEASPVEAKTHDPRTIPLILLSLIPGVAATMWGTHALWPVIAGLTFLAAILFRWPLTERRSLPRRWVLTLLIILNLMYLTFLAVAPDKDENGISTAQTTTAYLLVSSLLIMFSRSTHPADRAILLFIGFLFFIIAAIEKSAAFLPTFLVYLVVAFTLWLTLRYSRHREKTWARIRRHLKFTAMLLPPTMALSGLFFILLPRPFSSPVALRTGQPEGSSDTEHGTGTMKTGLEPAKQTATFSLDRMQKMLRNKQLLGRVTLKRQDARPFEPTGPLYLRGEVFDRYLAGAWSSTHTFSELRDAEDGRKDGKIVLKVRQMARLRFPLVSGDAEWIVPSQNMFFLSQPTHLVADTLLQDREGNYKFPTIPPPKRYQWEAHVLIPAIDDLDDLTAATGRPEDLSLPENLASIKTFAARIDQKKLGLKERITAIKHFLSERCAYALDAATAPEGTDPTVFFLTESYEGFCTHYASSMVLMLRASGIPSRLAVGFLLKERSEDGRSFMVRGSNGHAWVEVLTNELGWFPVDPTPPQPASSSDNAAAGPASPETPSPPEETRPEERWDNAILAYQQSQLRVLLGEVAHFFSSVVQSVIPVLPVLLAVAGGFLAVILVLSLMLPRKITSRIRIAASGFRKSSSVDFYQHFLWLLARKRIRKEPTMTAHEFCVSLRSRLPEKPLEHITGKFYQVRYEGIPLSEQDRGEIENSLAEIEKSLSQTGRA